MRNSSLGLYVPVDFSPPEHIVVVNALFYASLRLMLLAAFIAMLIKGWVREFDRGLQAMSLSERRAKTCEFRYLGMQRWKLPEMVEIIPLLIQVSLLLFSIRLIVFLFHVSKPSFGVTTAIFGIGIMPSPRLYPCLLPPRPSALLFRAPSPRCTNTRMLISVQTFIIGPL